MKKIVKYITIIAAASFVFSCAKEAVVSEELAKEEPKVEEEVFEYIFRVSGKDNDETKTTLDGTTVKWESGDKIGIYATGTANKFGAISELDPVQFPVYLTKALSAGDKVYCYYPQSTANNSNEADAIQLTIPAEQTGDFDAMPQVSLPYEVTADMATGTNNVDDIYFCNIGSVARFYVYSSAGAYTSETVESITFTANTGLAGAVTFDLTAVDYSNQSTLATSGYAARSAKVTASPTIGTSTSNAGIANLVIAPGTYYGTVVLLTDKAKYTYTISEPNKITFGRSQIKKIALNLESATCVRDEYHPVGEVFVPATSIAAGDKILLTSGTSGTIYVMGYQKANNRDAVSYAVDGAIISTADMYPMIVAAGTTEPSYFTLYDKDTDGYLAATTPSSNTLKTNEDVSVDTEWEIEINSSSQATKLQATGSSNRKVMQFNNGDTKLFNCYSSASQSPVYIFKMSTATVVSAANQEISYSTLNVEIDYNVYNASGTTTAAFETNPGSCASNLVINEGTKKVTFDITANTGSTRIVEVNITNNGVTKTVSITQAAAPTKLVMGSITATPDQNEIVFSWDAVSNATGYQVSINGGSSYLTKQAATSYTWTGLDPLTEYTLYVMAIGDGGVYYLDSDPVYKAATTLAPILSLPSSVSWDKENKTVSWTDTNTGAGTYGTDYKYVYTLDDGVSTNDASTSTTAVLTITEAATIKIKAVALTEDHRSSAFTSGTNLTFTAKKYYVKVTSTSALEVNGKYLIVNESHDGFSPYTSAGKPTATDLSEAYDSVNDRFDSSDADVISCTIVLKDPNTSGTNRFSMLMSNNRYVKGQSGKTDFAASNATMNANTFDWVFSFSSGVCLINSQAQTTRYIQWNGSAFGNYANTSTGDVFLYKLEN